MSGDNEESSKTEDDKGASVEFISSIPIVGPFMALIMRLSGDGRKNFAWLVVFLIIYPVLAFTLVLIILRFSPSFMQDGARNFVLSSLGVEDSVRAAISQNNKVIDFARAANFNGKEKTRNPTKQSLRIGQRVQMRTDLSTDEKRTSDPNDACFAYRFPKQLERYGRVFVALEDQNKGESYEVTKKNGNLGEINSEIWKKITGIDPIGDAEEHAMVEWSWFPSTELLAADPNDCASVDVSLGITVFKS